MGYSTDWLLGEVEKPDEDLYICERAKIGGAFYCRIPCDHREPHQKNERCDIPCPFSHGGECIPI